MLENASKLGAKATQLEVINNNLPACDLIVCKDFKETGEYLVMHRATDTVLEL